MSDKVNIVFSVNGRSHVYAGSGKKSLLHYLREELGLFGTKNGCGNGQCGACTVIVNGEAKRACLIRMGKVEGAQVQTVEGLASGGKLHPLQVAFVNTGAVQCGFCTPGLYRLCPHY